MMKSKSVQALSVKKLKHENKVPETVQVTEPNASPVATGNGCNGKAKGDACSYGAAPNGICDNALNGSLLFCIPVHQQ